MPIFKDFWMSLNVVDCSSEADVSVSVRSQKPIISVIEQMLRSAVLYITVHIVLLLRPGLNL